MQIRLVCEKMGKTEQKFWMLALKLISKVLKESISILFLLTKVSKKGRKGKLMDMPCETPVYHRRFSGALPSGVRVPPQTPEVKSNNYSKNLGIIL